jgi:hypothetical protein
MTPTDKLAVTLEAHQWNVVIMALYEIPKRIADPLIAEVQRQCTAAAQTDGPDALRQGGQE